MFCPPQSDLKICPGRTASLRLSQVAVVIALLIHIVILELRKNHVRI